MFASELLPVHERADTVFGQLLRSMVKTYQNTRSWFLYAELGLVRPSTMEESFAVSGLARFIAGRSNLGYTLALAVLAHFGSESTSPPSGGASLSCAYQRDETGRVLLARRLSALLTERARTDTNHVAV